MGEKVEKKLLKVRCEARYGVKPCKCEMGPSD